MAGTAKILHDAMFQLNIWIPLRRLSSMWTAQNIAECAAPPKEGHTARRQRMPPLQRSTPAHGRGENPHGPGHTAAPESGSTGRQNAWATQPLEPSHLPKVRDQFADFP